MSTQPQTRLTPEQYLEQERRAEYKSEYYQGEVFAMSGASRKHALIVGDVYTHLNNSLDFRACEVYGNDMRVSIPATGLFTYPDVTVVFGEPQFLDNQFDTLLNPTVIIEVLSPSTQDYDRGQKFEHYRSVPSLVDYILVAQDRAHVEHFHRQEDGRWLLTETDDLNSSVSLPSIGCELPLQRIYARVLP